jgi:ElaB/YqjD/DUF883 family membrane-anchored ribosome-binding protein
VSQTISNVKNMSRTSQANITTSATEVWTDMKHRAGDIRRSTEVYVRRNPLPTMAAALFTGFAIGMLFYALELRNERIRVEMEGRPLRRLRSGMNQFLRAAGDRAISGYETSRDAILDLADQIPARRMRRQNRITSFFRNAMDRISSVMS